MKILQRFLQPTPQNVLRESEGVRLFCEASRRVDEEFEKRRQEQGYQTNKPSQEVSLALN